MHYIARYMKPFRWRAAGGITVKFFAAVLELMIPYILEYMIDDVVLEERLSLVLLWGAIMIGTALLVMFLNIYANRIAGSVARDSIRCLRHDLFQKTICLTGTRFDEITLPSLISRMTADTYVVQTFIGMIQRMGVRAPILLIGGIFVSSMLDPYLALLLLCMVPVLAFIILFVSRKGIPLFYLVQEQLDRLTRILRENITGVRVVKALSKTDYETRRYQKQNDVLTHADLKAGITMALPNPVLNLFLNLGLSFVVLMGAYRVNSGAMQPGVILAFLTYFNMILQAVMGINRIFMQYTKAGASAGRIGVLLDLPEDELTPKEPALYPPAATTDYITFDNVSFSYPVSEQHYDELAADRENCVSNISFSLKAGESLGIIGATGSGKSTLIHLLMRFYDVSEGAIYVNGADIRTLPLKKLRSQMGVVFQNDTIFADTLEENIAFGQALSKEQLQTAADHAGIGDFIRGLPEGFSYMAAKAGANLSGGQKQRILIARALAKQPSLLILDDASSALDYRTDAKLRATLRKEYPSLTTIVIAQRVSSIKDMSHILVLDAGQCIGYGTHDELLKSCPIYREIYESQMGTA